MEEEQRRWLDINRDELLKGIDVRQVADHLVQLCVLSPSDEYYQEIVYAEKTHIGQARCLLEFLSRKGSAVIQPFQDILREVEPDLIKRCSNVRASNVSQPPPTDILTEVDALIKSHYCDKKQDVIPLFSWMKDKHCYVSDFFLNLAMIDRKEAEKMIGDRQEDIMCVGSCQEDDRRDYVLSNPREQAIYQLEDLFKFSEDGNLMSLGRDGHVTLGPDVGAGRATASCQRSTNRSCALPSGRFVGLYGGAGCGKTASCLKALREYGAGKLWREFKLVLFWQLRRPAVQSAKTLNELLRVLPIALTEDQCILLSHRLESTDGEGVLLALDGIDELRRPVHDAYVLQLLERSRLRKACILATSRPCDKAEEYFKHDYLRYELLGFTDAQVEAYIKRCLGDNLARRLQDFLHTTPQLAGLMYVPLLAAMLCEIFRINADDPPKTRTILYSKIAAHCFQRAVAEGRIRSIKVHKIDRFGALTEFKSKDSAAWKMVKRVASLAYIAQQEKKQVFGGDLLDKAGCGEKSIEIGLLVPFWADAKKELCVRREYMFSHLTFQEFLAAFHIVRKVRGSKAKLENFWTSEKPHSFVWQFVAGLLSDGYNQELRQHLFGLLNKWLHDAPNPARFQEWTPDWLRALKDIQSRLRQCLQCVQEACPNSTDEWPTALHLPESVQVYNITPSRLIMLAKAVRFCKNDHLRSIELQYGKHNGKSQEAKASRVQTQTAEATTQLVASLESVASLQTIAIDGPRHEFMEERCWLSLLNVTRGNKLTSVSLWRCSVGNDKACQLVNALDFSLLTSLSLSYNRVGDAGVSELSKALRNNMMLKFLYLGCNDITDAGLKSLARALQGNSTLRKLYLNNNRIGNSGAIALASVLKDNQTLERLYLYQNIISDRGTCALADALQDNHTMVFLRITENSIGDEGSKSLHCLLNSGRCRMMIDW